MRVEAKPEVRKAGGVYYTPAYIVDYIVENTVGALLKDKTPDQAANCASSIPLAAAAPSSSAPTNACSIGTSNTIRSIPSNTAIAAAKQSMA